MIYHAASIEAIGPCIGEILGFGRCIHIQGLCLVSVTICIGYFNVWVPHFQAAKCPCAREDETITCPEDPIHVLSCMQHKAHISVA